jgi:hypothetical protein
MDEGFVVDVDEARKKSGESARLKVGGSLPQNG